MSASDENHENWIDSIYGAVEDPSQLDAFLSAFGQRMRARLVTFSIQYSDRPDVSISKYSGGSTEEDLIEYKTKWVSQDPWMARVMFGQYPIGRIVPSQEICPDEELEPTEFYKQWLSPRGMHYGGGVYLSNGANQKSILSLTRPKEIGPLTDGEIAFWQSLVPHLSRAVRLHGEREKIRAERDALMYYLDSGPIGVVLMTEQARVLVTNLTARELMKSAGVLFAKDDRLRFADSSMQREVLAAIEKKGSRIPHVDWSIEQFKLGGITALIAPAYRGDVPRLATNLPTVLLYLIDSTRPQSVSPEVVMKAFSLTPSEAKFAALLAEGSSVDEAAAALFVSSHTARTHLKHIFAKTGCKRQAELVALVLRVVSHLPMPE